MDTLLNHPRNSLDLRDLLQRPVILELDALTQSDKVFFVQSILLYIHHLRMAEPEREQFKHAIVIEEAHHVLSNERQSLVGGQSVMDITFREIREFGEAVIVLDQHPSQISMPALGNAYCTICFNLKHRSDVSAMGMAMLLPEDQKNILGELEVGRAIVRMAGRFVKPFMIAVPEFSIHKGTFSDTDVMAHMTKLGLMAARSQPIQRAPGFPGLTSGMFATMTGIPSATPRAAPSLQDSSLAMLQDIQRFPASGIAERYKRLGLSVRQGQKLKRRLIDALLIAEQIVTTHAGKLRVVQLTEQGQLELSRESQDDPVQP